MDMEEIDDLLSEFSEGTFALVSGIAIIITIIFFIYAVVPLYGEHTFIVLLSFLSLLACFCSPIFFRLSKITLAPDVVGWLLAGITIAIFGWLIFHGAYYVDILSLQYIIPSGLFGFASSLPLTKGVLLPLFAEGELGTFETDLETEEEIEDTEESDSEGQLERDFEVPDEESDEEDILDEEKISEEDKEPW
ncbi:MAG: hypothetical protein V5A66_02185 [Candidatus Thermoplasmatota archaeon]